MLDKLVERLEATVEDNSETGTFRCRRDIFTDPELFELEMKHIWEGNWIYLAHESQKIASQFRVDTPVAVEATSCQQKPPKGGQV